MNALTLTILSGLSIPILFGSKRWALLSIVAGALYLTEGMALTVAGFSLYPARFLILVALARIIVRREFAVVEMNRIDHILILLYTYSFGVFLLRSNEGLTYQLGVVIDSLSLYFTFRTLVRTFDDFKWLIRKMVFLLIPYVPLLWIESITSQNLFAVVGGVELARAGDLWFREGRLRAAGSFLHPSLLGTFGGIFLPIYMAMWLIHGERIIGAIGTCLCIAIVAASNSGGPALCAVAAFIGWMIWPLRFAMRSVRRALAAMIVLLALVMKAPIWYLLARLGSITGGDGYHRAALLDVAFQNLDKWWLAGMPLSGTMGWLPYNNVATGHVDITNYFLLFGLDGGVGSVLLFVALLVSIFSHLGRSMSIVRSQHQTDNRVELLLWALGVVVFIHIVNWFGITYFDQMDVFWFLQLALVGSLTNLAEKSESKGLNPCLNLLNPPRLS